VGKREREPQARFEEDADSSFKLNPIFVHEDETIQLRKNEGDKELT
jgi:hypothetical protein